MKINDLKRALKNSSQDDLINTLTDLYRKNSFVKDYFVAKYSDRDGSELIEKHKQIIENEFFSCDRSWSRQAFSSKKIYF